MWANMTSRLINGGVPPTVLIFQTDGWLVKESEYNFRPIPTFNQRGRCLETKVYRFWLLISNSVASKKGVACLIKGCNTLF
jgi:hypothetical protein